MKIQQSFLFTFLLGLILILPAYAAVPMWQIVPAESALTFTAIQNGAPVSGKFNKFSGEIAFDPKQLDVSHVRIVVTMDSIATTYQELTTTLESPDWLSSKMFPQAIFTASHFVEVGKDTYQSKDGQLTIRDKTQPVAVLFTIVKNEGDKGQVKGMTVLQRNAFGVGQGEWASTKEVKDDVKVNFNLTVVKSK